MGQAVAAGAVRGLLYTAFGASGIAGLLYELGWSRYLALLVGHAAYAQVLVIAVFLGGLAAGSLIVGRRSRSLRAPLAWYAAAEVTLAIAGFAFHPAFRGISDLAYAHLFPALGSPGLTAAAQWLLATLLILPQSVLLGTTFPLMAAGLLRVDPNRAGRTVAILYFVNSLGGAFGVLLGGFGLVAWAGLPGVLAGAAVLSGAAAALAAVAHRSSADVVSDAAGLSSAAEARRPWARAAETELPALWRFLLGASFLTALASFIYEVAWLRMLSLVMGSATHAFEIMLSAFILGLAVGALMAAPVVDRSRRPLRALGWVQWLMGLTALSTLLLYPETFDLVGRMVRRLGDQDAGYTWFNLARYGIALAVMLPSTLCAGLTLPLIMGTLLHAGAGERSIGWVYGINTLGSVVGVALAGLVLLPALGLEGLLAAGAAVDMALGVAILAFAVRGREAGSRSTVALAAVLSVLALATVTGLVQLDRRVLLSGVYRYGVVPAPGEAEVLYYADGRTATVGVHRLVGPGLTVLSTNGKPDASLGDRWFRALREPVEPAAIVFQDEATQVIAAVVALAHAPRARDVAMIGLGSGVTGHTVLADPGVHSLVTVEIEPRMVEGARYFRPANARVFDDPRSRIVIADAKAYFAQGGDRYDLIVSEPSNPWVSGTASLFTREFYDRVRGSLRPGGVLAQWIQLYELTDRAATTVLAALHQSFADYRAFLVGDSDLLIVATRSGSLPEPDWGWVRTPDLVHDLRHIPPLVPVHLDALRLFDRADVAPLLRSYHPANSDYFPHLDLAAEEARFHDRFASGLFGLARDRFDVVGALAGRKRNFAPYRPVAVWGLPQMRALARGGWIRDVRDGRLGPPGATGFRDGPRDIAAAVPTPTPAEYRDAYERYRTFLDGMQSGRPPAGGWIRWSADFRAVERLLHGETSGVADSLFYGEVRAYLEAQGAPVEPRAVVDFFEGLSTWRMEQASAAGGVLMEPVAEGMAVWVDPATLLDGTVTARLLLGDVAGARAALRRLVPASGREDDDFRVALLRAHLSDRGVAAPGKTGR